MIKAISNNPSLGKIAGAGITSAKTPVAEDANGSSFADVLKNSLDDVSRLQQNAGRAVEGLTLGKTENVADLMTAIEKSELAFKTLLIVRAKLMDAYEEIKNIQI